jgi:Bacterial Ig-like domain (group 1)
MEDRIRRALLTFAFALVGSLAIAGPAFAAINPVTGDATGAGQLAAAMDEPPSNVTGASFDAVPPTGTPNAVIDAPLSFFPTDGQTAALITTGNAQLADDPNSSGSSGANGGGGNVRGNTDFDVTVLKVAVNVPQGANCLTFDFAFYSDEFPEFVNTQYNDAFIAELDNSTWTTVGSTISAPNNFAFDPSGDVISINSSGATSMNAANAAGTTYDGATPLLSASTQVTPGAHNLYLSIFDQGDHVYDSATLLDSLRIGFVPNPQDNCAPGAQPKEFSLALSPASDENPVGTQHTVTATLSDENGDPVNAASVKFTVNGANSGSGTGTTNSSGEATFTYTGTSAGDDVIAACYDADSDNVCEASASATKKWTSANNPPDCSHVTADRNRLWPPNHKLVLVTLSGATDPDGDPVTINVTGVTQDEPLNGLGDGDTSPDAMLGPQPNQVKLRAERAGNRDGRVYRIAFQASDGKGGTCTGSVRVGVPHDLGHAAVPVDSGQTVNSLGP